MVKWLEFSRQEIVQIDVFKNFEVFFLKIIGFDKTLYFFLLKIKVYDKTHLYGYFNLGHLPPVRLLEFSLFPPCTLIPSCTFINF